MVVIKRQGVRKVPHHRDFKEFVQYGFRLSQNTFENFIKSQWCETFRILSTFCKECNHDITFRYFQILYTGTQKRYIIEIGL